MIWLVLGVGLWTATHLVPTVGRPLRAALVGAMGENAYKGVFALTVVAAVILMVIGWRSTTPVAVYWPPLWAGHLAALLMVFSFILFGAAKQKTRIKQYIRHPQLTGVILWAVAHLIANGDSRSLVLFGGLGLWALLEIQLINARDGAWTKPDIPSMGVEVRGLAISLAILAVFVFLHPYFAGVPVFVG